MPTRRHGPGSTFTEDSWTVLTPDGTLLRTFFPPRYLKNNHTTTQALQNVKRFFSADLLMCQCAQVPKTFPAVPPQHGPVLVEHAD